MMSAILFKSPEGPQLHETKLTCNEFSNAPSHDPNHHIQGLDTPPLLFDSAKFQLNNEAEQGMSNTIKQANKKVCKRWRSNELSYVLLPCPQQPFVWKRRTNQIPQSWSCWRVDPQDMSLCSGFVASKDSQMYCDAWNTQHPSRDRFLYSQELDKPRWRFSHVLLQNQETIK